MVVAETPRRLEKLLLDRVVQGRDLSDDAAILNLMIVITGRLRLVTFYNAITTPVHSICDGHWSGNEATKTRYGLSLK
jgi:hypothetical protein